MAAHRVSRDVGADESERSDFPIVCNSCLGDNPYVKMSKQQFSKECKICTRPFTVFRWRPGRDARFKKTVICQNCSNEKNVCQVCILDLDYALPVQVRDTALGMNSDDAIPQSFVNRECFRARPGTDYESSYGRVRPTDSILKLQRTGPYYKRNRPNICSFFARGECTRGLECAFRHEMPVTGELSQQNIKDRYHGVNDRVAVNLLRRAGEMASLEPPEDGRIRKPQAIQGSDEARQQAHSGVWPMAYYPSMDRHRMAAHVPSQEGIAHVPSQEGSSSSPAYPESMRPPPQQW